MKRAFLSLAASGLLFAAACGDAATEEVSHQPANPPAAGSSESGGTGTSMADTLSTNTTLPGSTQPSGSGD